jgi:uncharacterized membrane protein YdjX (TVP38/TMEM64 family)
MLYQYFESFKMFIENQDKFTAAVYLIIAKIIAGATFIPGTPLTLISGALLGTFWGSVVSIIGNTLGALLAFIIARYLLGNFIQDKLVKKYPKIKEYENKLFQNGFLTIVFLRLIPLFPFNALNFILGVTRVSFKDYFLGTLIGIIPGTIAFVYFGESLKMLSIYNIALAILAIIGLSYLGKFWKLK